MLRAIVSILLLTTLAACGGGGGGSSSATSPTDDASYSYVTTDLRSTTITNTAAYIVPQCYTVTQPQAGGTAYNPCFTCHTASIPPNYIDDMDLQLEYSFPAALLTNPWTNLFVDRSAEVAAISDAAILEYIRTDNYLNSDGEIILAKKLNNLALDWDFDEDGVWDGYIPDCRFNFDDEGFDRHGDDYTGWRAFAYASFPSTFWPTNGSVNDVLIRLADSFHNDTSGAFDLDVYKINLAIVEAMVSRRDVLLYATVDETRYAVDLNKDGRLATADTVVYDWAPTEGREMSYVGQAKTQLDAGELHIAAGLFPEGSEFLHTVRYVDLDDTSDATKLAPRIKELRYAIKRTWQTYSELLQAALDEVKENDDFPDRTRQLIGNVEQGMNNDQGWLYQGFIEDANGDLRPQTYEETAFCIGCHSGIGATVDGIFSFPRKLAADRTERQGWYHWTQINRQGTVEPKIEIDGAGVQYEYSFYLMYNGAGDEFRNNTEVMDNFFIAEGEVDSDKLQELHDDVSLLLYPSRERALEMAKAYKVIVEEQSYIHGRDATVTAPANVHQTIAEGLLTGVETPTNKGAFINALGPVQTLHDDNAISHGSDELTTLTGGDGSTPDSSRYQIDSNGLIYAASYSLAGADFGFSFPPRLPLPTRQLIPNDNIESCYRCHRLPSPMPPNHPDADPTVVLPDSYASEAYTLTQLTSDPAQDTMPVTSPDGNQVSWVSTRNGQEQIWLMNPDGTNLHQLSVSPYLQGWQRFSPNSQHIAFWAYDTVNALHLLQISDLYGNVITLDSSSQGIERPVFTPDGNYIAYAKQTADNWDLWLISIDGLTSYQLTSAIDMETSPWFNTDGVMAYKVAPSGEYGLTVEQFMTFENGYANPHIYTWDGPHSVQLSDMASDGISIAFTAEAMSDTSGKDRISYLAVIADLTLDDITDTASADNMRLISKSATLGDRGILFSPDASKAVFWSYNQDGRAGLWLYDVVSDTSTQLTTQGYDFEPVWSADGTSLFFTSTRDGNQYDIWKLDL
jgi:Tol biopolymer transport system component